MRLCVRLCARVCAYVCAYVRVYMCAYMLMRVCLYAYVGLFTHSLTCIDYSLVLYEICECARVRVHTFDVNFGVLDSPLFV